MRKQIRSILLESVAQRAYHFTSHASEIIEDNKLHASTVAGTSADASKNRGRFYFISLTRSGKDGYRLDHTKLVLDGEKLNHNYKGVPVDYWGYGKNPSAWGSPKQYADFMKNSQEKEDRLLLNKPYLENIRKYIIEVHHWMDRKGGWDVNIAKKIEYTCKKYNIPFFVYDNQKDFLYENKEKSISINTPEYNEIAETYSNKEAKQQAEWDQMNKEAGITKEQKREYQVNMYVERLVALLSYENPKNETWIKKNIFGLESDQPFPERIKRIIEKDEDYYFSRMNSSYNQKEYYSVVTLEIHNLRTNTDEESVKILELLRKDMKQYKAKDIMDYLAKKFDLEEEYKMRSNPNYYKDKDKQREKDRMGDLALFDSYRIIPWANYAWNQASAGEVMKELPTHLIGDMKAIKLFNDETTTMKALYNFLMKNVGKKETYRIFKDVMEIEIRYENE